ncbi:MAG: hypothetical protein SXV54_28005 [Chloroflexota bacterium]|nr:hypothetical protein [Chloroflexota bacterium]
MNADLFLLHGGILEVGLLLNFGPRPEIKRKAFDNSRKESLRWLEKQPA